MTRLRRAIRRFFARLLGFQKPTTPGVIARLRLQELREQSRRWEIRPPSSECDLPLGTELGAFRDEKRGRSTTEPAGRIRISVNRIRFR
jgi:hypothetical protein